MITSYSTSNNTNLKLLLPYLPIHKGAKVKESVLRFYDLEYFKFHINSQLNYNIELSFQYASFSLGESTIRQFPREEKRAKMAMLVYVGIKKIM